MGWIGFGGLRRCCRPFFICKLLGNARNAAFVVPLGGVRGMSGKWAVRFGGRDLYPRQSAVVPAKDAVNPNRRQLSRRQLISPQSSYGAPALNRLGNTD